MTAKFTSDFALLDVKTGRAKLARLCETNHIVPVFIRGFIQPGAGGIGYDDGTSREFSVTVESAVFGEPEKVRCSTTGRIYARLGDLKAGDTVDLDGGFTCSPKKRQKLKEDGDGLYFKCSSGKHYLAGQDEDGFVIGVFKVG